MTRDDVVTGDLQRARSIAVIALCAPFLAAAAPVRDYFDRADLQAQREMAHWAAVMTVSAWLGLIVSLIGVILIWRTLQETRRAAELTVAEAKATVQAARDSLSAEHRPWLVLEARSLTDLHSFGDEDEEYVGFKLDWLMRNVGRSPAVNVREPSFSMLAIGNDHQPVRGTPPEDKYRNRYSNPDRTVFPGEEVKGSFHGYLTAHDWQAARDHPDRTWLFLHVIGTTGYRSPYVQGEMTTEVRLQLLAWAKGTSGEIEIGLTPNEDPSEYHPWLGEPWVSTSIQPDV